MNRAAAAQRPRPLSSWPADVLRAGVVALQRASLRRRLAIGAAAIVLLLLGWLWVRDSPLVAVSHVQIRGVHGVQAANIEAALAAAARRESTLDVHIDSLAAAVAPYRLVRDLRVSTSFPHTMRITVVERLPVAALVAGGQRTAVAADGLVLGPDLADASTPVLDVSLLPSGRVRDPHVLAQLTVLGTAPAPLARRIAGISPGASGIAVAMRNGPSIIFGDDTRPHAKWAAAARVLADPTSAGARYVDVRLPDRPAAGGLADTAAGPGGQVTATDPTAAALAATLASAVSGSGAAAGTPDVTTSSGGTGSGASTPGASTGAGAGGATAGTTSGTPTAAGGATVTGAGATGNAGGTAPTSSLSTGTGGGTAATTGQQSTSTGG